MRVNLDNDESNNGLEDGVDFGALLKEHENATSGEIQVGKIIQINDEFAMIALPYSKVESRLPVSEIKDKNDNFLFKEGDEIEVYVERGRVSHQKAIRIKRTAQRIKEIGNEILNKVIEAKVIQKNKGGFVMDYDGIDVFLPRRESAFKEGFKVEGKSYKVMVTKISEEKNSIIVSRKKFFDFEKNNRKAVVERLLSGDKVVKARVNNTTTFGVFVDIDNVEGLIHYTELSHKGPVNPQKYFKVGDELEVKILGYDEGKKRLTLSLKALMSDPWQEIGNTLEVGYAIKVVVTNIEEYGAFVDLGNDIEGFLHISEISWDKNIKHPKDYLKIGQEIDVEIIEIDLVNKRLRVSLKKLLHKPFSAFAKAHKENETITGKIVTLADFGAFINLGTVDGLLHNEDAFWERGLRCKDTFKVGDEIEVKIVRIDSVNERISLSKRLLSDSPAKAFAKKHGIDSIVEGVVIDIKDFGVFIEVDGVEVLVKNEDIPKDQIENLKKGDTLKCAIYAIDERNNKVRASVKRLERVQNKENLKAFNQANKESQTMTLGDKIKNKFS